MEDDGDIQFIDPETNVGGYGKGEAYSHSLLVFNAIRRSLEAGSCELKAGYWNTKFDRFGNAHKIYVDDTRKIFVSSIKMVETIITCDLDKEANDKIKELKEKIDKKYQEYLVLEKNDWKNASIELKKRRWSNGVYFKEGILSQELQYAQEFLQEETEIYAEILKELIKLTKRLDFYKSEVTIYS